MDVYHVPWWFNLVMDLVWLGRGLHVAWVLTKLTWLAWYAWLDVCVGFAHTDYMEFTSVISLMWAGGESCVLVGTVVVRFFAHSLILGSLSWLTPLHFGGESGYWESNQDCYWTVGFIVGWKVGFMLVGLVSKLLDFWWYFDIFCGFEGWEKLVAGRFWGPKGEGEHMVVDLQRSYFFGVRCLVLLSC